MPDVACRRMQHFVKKAAQTKIDQTGHGNKTHGLTGCGRWTIRIQTITLDLKLKHFAGLDHKDAVGSAPDIRPAGNPD